MGKGLLGPLAEISLCADSFTERRSEGDSNQPKTQKT